MLFFQYFESHPAKRRQVQQSSAFQKFSSSDDSSQNSSNNDFASSSDAQVEKRSKVDKSSQISCDDSSPTPSSWDVKSECSDASDVESLTEDIIDRPQVLVRA